MDVLRGYHEYLKRLKTTDIEMDHTWSYHYSKFMAVIKIWYDSNDYPHTTRWQRTMSILIRIFVPLMWASLFVEYCKNFRTIPISAIAQGFSLICGFLLTNYHITQYSTKRDVITKLIADVDRKYQEMQRVDTDLRRQQLVEIRKIYITQGYVGIACLFMGFMLGGVQGVFTLVTGDLYYESALPFDQTSYSLQWFIQSTYQTLVVVFLGIFFSTKELLFLGLFYDLTVLFKVQSEDIRHLCHRDRPNFNEEIEYRKFQAALKEISDLLEIGRELKDFMSLYLFIMIAAFNTILPMAGLSLIIEWDQGSASVIIQSMYYPAYCVAIMLCWSVMGEVFSDGFEGTKYAVYETNWPDFSERMKRMLIIYQVRCQKGNFIEGGSFFILTMMCMTDLFQRTYYILTLLGDMF